ncbi:murein biosynthesis integral membrane protein MurJ [Patescibacteria group bacterium]|nr:murein biosynthesis integral membrane protein MurJ [Patescibacteria group bacterium]
MVTLAFSNVLGVIRDHFLAQKIPTDQLDIYYAAFRLPDFLLNVLILGAIAAAVIPVLGRTLRLGEKEAWQLINNLLSLGVSVMLVAIIVLYFLLPCLLPFIVPDFPLQKLHETINLARLMLLSPLFFSVSYIVGSVLNVKKRFFMYSLAPIMYNLAIISATVIGAHNYGVRAPVVGVVAGAFLHMAIQLPVLFKLGFRPQFIFSFASKEVRRIFKLMLPRAIALGAGQIQLVAFTAFASSIAGAIAIFNLTDNIQTVPTVILGVSFATAAFPSLAQIGGDNLGEFRRLLIKVSRVILFLVVPSAVALFVLRAQVVRLILGYGYFDWSDTRQAVDTLAFFTVGIVAQSLIPLLARAYYSLENTRFPMMAAIVAVVVGVVGGYFGAEKLGVAGLALAFTIASWTQMFILLVGLEARIHFRLTKEFWLFVLKVLILAVITAFVMQITKLTYGAFGDIDKVYNLFLQTLLATLIGGATYIGGAWLWRIPEIRK